MQCSEFENLLSEALDGTLSTELRERFDAHRASCAACGLMFAEAEAGMNWLGELEEVTPPVQMVQRIMLATSGAQSGSVPAIAAARESFWQKLRRWTQPALRPILQPRFAMSFAMAFFSISTLLNFAGVNLRDLGNADLHPSAIRNSIVRSYYGTQARVVHYWDNLRFVYEIESRVRELKNATEQNTQPKRNDENNNKKQDNSSRGDQDRSRDQREYSRELSDTMLASAGTGISTRSQYS